MKIVILDGYTLNPGDLSWKGFEELGEVTVYERTPYEMIVERIGEASIVITNKTPITKEVMENTNIEYIGVLATGYNVIDIEYASAKGITVTNIPSYGTEAVAQMVFAHLLEICSRVGEHNQAVKDGEWSSSRDFCFWKRPLIELSGKTMGIIGYGRIGEATSKIARAFGMKVLAYRPSAKEGTGENGVNYVELEELLGNSDVISLHCPLTENTRGIINRKTIEKMKNGVIIINTSRGPLIVEKDLADALNSGKVYAAGLDVVAEEPIREDNPLLSAENAFITPHIAWAPREARERLMNIAVDNLSAYLKGNEANIVNK